MRVRLGDIPPTRRTGMTICPIAESGAAVWIISALCICDPQRTNALYGLVRGTGVVLKKRIDEGRSPAMAGLVSERGLRK
jgi:hypothetical protein